MGDTTGVALSFNEKTSRVLRLLIGTRHPEVLAALQRRGFTAADLDEGWALLRALGVADYYEVEAPEAERDPWTELDAWENRWYPIVRATLERHYPSLARQVFRRLSQTRGNEVILGVMVFLDRIRDLETGAHGEAGKKARRLLARRGLTAGVVAVAQQLIERIQTIPEPAAQPPSSDRSEELEAMWAWYREWSQLVRTELHDGRLLRGLGLSATHRPRPR